MQRSATYLLTYSTCCGRHPNYADCINNVWQLPNNGCWQAVVASSKNFHYFCEFFGFFFYLCFGNLHDVGGMVDDRRQIFRKLHAILMQQFVGCIITFQLVRISFEDFVMKTLLVLRHPAALGLINLNFSFIRFPTMSSKFFLLVACIYFIVSHM